MLPVGPKEKQKALRRFVEDLDLKKEPVYDLSILKCDIDVSCFLKIVVALDFRQDHWTVFVVAPQDKIRFSRSQFEDRESALVFVKNILLNPDVALLLPGWREL